jgi:hypothetical protein
MCRGYIANVLSVAVFLTAKVLGGVFPSTSLTTLHLTLLILFVCLVPPIWLEQCTHKHSIVRFYGNFICLKLSLDIYHLCVVVIDRMSHFPTGEGSHVHTIFGV